MNIIRSSLIGFCLAMSAASTFALTLTATFQPVAPGSNRYTLNGFGRAVNAAPPALTALAASPTAFHDRYLLLGLPLGEFSLDSTTPVTWSGGFEISAVSLSWLEAGPTFPFIDFVVDASAKTATGTGNFTVTCATCVFLDVYGTENGPGKYGSPFQVSAVPEPESYALILAGLSVLALWMRRRALA